MSFSEPVGVQRDIGPFEHLSNSLLLALRRISRRSRVAKPVLWLEDAIEARRQGRLARRRWMATPNFEICCRKPDQGADPALRGALGVGEGIEFVDQTFGMDPAQAMFDRRRIDRRRR